MSIDTLDMLIAALPGQHVPIWKDSLTLNSSGDIMSQWRNVGMPGAGSAVTGLCDKTTAGAFPLPTVTGGNSLYLYSIQGTNQTTEISIILYDRIYQNSGLLGNTGSVQSFTTPTWSRTDTTGAGAELWVEVYTANTGSNQAISVSYTNNTGVSGQTATTTLSVAPKALMMYPLTMSAGDVGVQSVQSLQMTVTGATAGSFGVTVLKRVTEVHLNSIIAERNPFQLGLPTIDPNACLTFSTYNTTNAVCPAFFMDLILISG